MHVLAWNIFRKGYYVTVLVHLVHLLCVTDVWDVLRIQYTVFMLYVTHFALTQKKTLIMKGLFMQKWKKCSRDVLTLLFVPSWGFYSSDVGLNASHLSTHSLLLYGKRAASMMKMSGWVEYGQNQSLGYNLNMGWNNPDIFVYVHIYLWEFCSFKQQYHNVMHQTNKTHKFFSAVWEWDTNECQTRSGSVLNVLVMPWSHWVMMMCWPFWIHRWTRSCFVWELDLEMPVKSDGIPS